jgi:hypothetical protein
LNVASRMSTTCGGGDIQMTSVFHQQLGPEFTSQYRGEIAIKGKGIMKTYLLLDCQSDTPASPAPTPGRHLDGSIGNDGSGNHESLFGISNNGAPLRGVDIAYSSLEPTDGNNSNAIDHQIKKTAAKLQ